MLWRRPHRDFGRSDGGQSFRLALMSGSFCGGSFSAGGVLPVYWNAGWTGRRLSEDKSLRFGPGGQDAAGGSGVEDEDDGGESVAVGGAGVDDGGLQHAFHGAHGAGIKDVTVA